MSPALFLLFVTGTTVALYEAVDRNDAPRQSEWMKRVDQLLLHQEQRLQTMEAEIASLKTENQQLKEENEHLSADVRQLQDKLSLFPNELMSLKSLSQFHNQVQKEGQSLDVARRSDDPDSLQPVVTQMSQQLTDVSAKVQALQNSDVQQNAAIQEAGSSVYVRWGRSVCPDSSHLVYSGIMGGSKHDQPGAAPTPLCLTHTPVLSDVSFTSSYSAYLYGAEYQTYSYHHDQDALCAVCRSQRPTTIMVPGTNVCMAGWTLEYSGFLMADRYTHPGAFDFVCVDASMEAREGSGTDNNGFLLYYTVTQCGSLPCGPYVNNKVVTCAVCSK